MNKAGAWEEAEHGLIPCSDNVRGQCGCVCCHANYWVMVMGNIILWCN